MKKEQQQEALENALISYGFPKKYFIQPTGYGRNGAKFAIASKVRGELGGEALMTHSRFMTYDECNAYLSGYYAAKMKKL